MKKVFYLILVVLFIVGIWYLCQDSSNVESDTAVENVQDDCGEIGENGDEQLSEEDDSKIKEFLKDLYENYVFQYNDFSDISDHFSESIVQKLQNEFEYEGEGYAVWLFRSGAQDGSSEDTTVNNITSDGTGWYSVDITDMGYDVTCRFKVSVIDGEVYVSEFVNDNP